MSSISFAQHSVGKDARKNTTQRHSNDLHLPAPKLSLGKNTKLGIQAQSFLINYLEH